MKVTIRGNNPVTGDNVKDIIDKLNEEYEPFGLKVKNMTCYQNRRKTPSFSYGDIRRRNLLAVSNNFSTKFHERY